MISWLEGKKIQTWNQGSRKGLVLACNGVGYEVQISQRSIREIGCSTNLSLWIHQVIKDDGYFLFGFVHQNERDLFRKLISVTGIGPQLGMSLLEDNDYDHLISSIINGDINQLTRSSGVGRRTAERLVLELKNKLSNMTNAIQIPSMSETDPVSSLNNLNTDIVSEVISALKNLDYSDDEINSSINTVANALNMKKILKNSNESNPNKISFEELFKKTLKALSN